MVTLCGRLVRLALKPFGELRGEFDQLNRADRVDDLAIPPGKPSRAVET